MRAIRKRLTYANVVSTLALFLVLAGGAAWAAKVPKKSVGPRQLKANAVTTAKIRANAITTRKIKRNAVANAKIKQNAVDSSKIADGSVAYGDLNSSSMPFSRIAFEARGTATVAITEAKPSIYPLANPNYTQEAGRDDSFVGALDVTFEPSCKAPRHVTAFALLDSPDPSELKTLTNVVAAGMAADETGTQPAQRVELGSAPFVGGGFQPTSPTAHRIDIVSVIECEGGGDGAKATFGAVDVIGVK